MARLLSLLIAIIAALTGSTGARAALPPVKHVFVIVMENKDYAVTFGAKSPAPYLSKDLPAQGTLLDQYFGTSHLSLGNYISMVSGQGPNPITQSDCQIYTDVLPGTVGADGQSTGLGCVYPAGVKTVADQLEAKGLRWKGYMEDMGNSTTQSRTCRHPAPFSQDSTQSAKPGDQYAARHNPFVYFHSLLDSGSCANNDVPLTQLSNDLADPARTANYSFITPNLCHDGHDEPCVDGQPGGLVSTDAFLREWVPQITSSKAFQDDGLLIVTFDESDHGAEGCCTTDSPNTPNPGATTMGKGGGRVGAIVIGPYVRAGVKVSTPYNHYSLLRTTEDLFGLAPLGLAAKTTTKSFGDDVLSPMRVSAPPVSAMATCSAKALPVGKKGNLPRGSLIANAAVRGGKLRLRLARRADLYLRARGKRFGLHGGGACRSYTVALPRGTRSVGITATVRGARERRTVKV